jgi:hypothetical protein
MIRQRRAGAVVKKPVRPRAGDRAGSRLPSTPPRPPRPSRWPGPGGSPPEGGPARARGSRGEAAPPSEPYLRDDAGKVRRSSLRDGRVAWLREGRAFRVVSFIVFQIALRLIPRTPRPRARCPPAERRSVKFVQQRSCKLPARVEGNLRISSRKTAYPCTTAGDVKRGHRAGADVGGRRCRMAAAEELGLNPTGQSRPS